MRSEPLVSGGQWALQGGETNASAPRRAEPGAFEEQPAEASKENSEVRVRFRLSLCGRQEATWSFCFSVFLYLQEALY